MIALILICFVSLQSGSKPDLIQSDKPFSPSGVVKVESDQLAEVYKQIGKEPPAGLLSGPRKTEGGTINGVAYRFYYSSGSGSFLGKEGGSLDALEFETNWRVSCTKDAITDNKSCYMNRGDLFVFVYGTGAPVVVIGAKHHPKSETFIRIDDDAAISNGGLADGFFSPASSQRILLRLATAKKVTTRYHRWPDQMPTESWTVFGFNEAYQYIKWAIAHAK